MIVCDRCLGDGTVAGDPEESVRVQCPDCLDGVMRCETCQEFGAFVMVDGKGLCTACAPALPFRSATPAPSPPRSLLRESYERAHADKRRFR